MWLLVALVWVGVGLSRTWYALRTWTEEDVPVYMRARSQGYEPYYSTDGARGAVSCELDVCSNVGVYLLDKGGSAADAAIGVSSCVGAIDMFHSGIGGGGFALVKTRGNEPIMLDYRETAPARAHRDIFVGMPANASIFGGLAVAVPGEVRGWEQLHKLYGRLPWHEILAPAVTITRRGFRVPSQLYDRLLLAEGPICEHPALGRIYCPHGRLVQTGELIRLPDLARTYEAIARHGPDVMYAGPIAERMVNAVEAAGGIITMDDLRSYRVLVRMARSITYRNTYRIWATSMPSSGSVVLSALKTMEHFPDIPYDPNDVLHTHRLIEATKYAYGERTRFGDPAFVSNVTEMENRMVSADNAEARFRSINDTYVHPVEEYDPMQLDLVSDHGTSHLNVVDKDGMAIAATTTINGIWGSAVHTPDGILMNNDMDDFSSPDRSNQFGYVPSHANFIVPGKRPLSSMSPIMVENRHTGALELVVGSSGGSRIITANILTTYAYLSHHGNVSMDDVIARPRWHDQLLPPVTMFEYPGAHMPGYDNATVRALTAKGHRATYMTPGLSNAQAIQYTYTGSWHAASEMRQYEARGAAI